MGGEQPCAAAEDLKAMMDDDFYRERARHIRERADEGRPFYPKAFAGSCRQLRRNCEAISSRDGSGSAK
jgi:hypothetical protein